MIMFFTANEDLFIINQPHH